MARQKVLIPVAETGRTMWSPKRSYDIKAIVDIGNQTPMKSYQTTQHSGWTCGLEVIELRVMPAHGWGKRAQETEDRLLGDTLKESEPSCVGRKKIQELKLL